MEMRGQSHALATLPPRKTPYPLYRRLGSPQGQSEGVRKTRLPRVSNPRTVQTVSSRYTVYAVPAPCIFYITIIMTFYILVKQMIYGTWINPNNTNNMEWKNLSLWSVSRGETKQCTFLISTNYAKIFQNNMNKTEVSFVKSFIWVTYLYICLFMRSWVKKVSNKMSVNPYLLNIELNSTALSLCQIQCRAQLDTLLYSNLMFFRPCIIV